jgi:ATP-dependent RNA helicase RhlE
VPHERKTSLITEILRKENVESALVFLRTKQRTDRVAESLRTAGTKAQAIHGDLSPRQRAKALKDFREGQVKVLVATDVAARGLDVDGISHVINFDIPDNADDYLHRIGRTARANAEGHAITFVCPDDHMALESIERSLGKNLPRAEWEHAVSVLSLYTPPVEHKTNKSGTYRRPKSLFRRR